MCTQTLNLQFHTLTGDSWHMASPSALSRLAFQPLLGATDDCNKDKYGKRWEAGIWQRGRVDLKYSRGKIWQRGIIFLSDSPQLHYWREMKDFRSGLGFLPTSKTFSHKSLAVFSLLYKTDFISMGEGCLCGPPLMSVNQELKRRI